MSHDKHFRIGTFLKTKGLKGELQLYVDYDGLDTITYNAVFVDMAGKLVPYFVSSVKYQGNGAYLFLEDVDSVEKASRLVKKEVYLPKKLQPKKKKEEFTLMDLKGFIAIDENEGELGEILEIQELPQQYIASVQYKNREILFPLNESTIKGIDLNGGEVYVDLPEGLLDIYLQ
ncbi:MAG TPA: ribosome maturation factor RimM [Mucilaginibacter sp.]|jgi:16S rRNA processing protein RimM|nr:ribosome maturation factor RimM [Mucilaginibacter sp.]